MKRPLLFFYNERQSNFTIDVNEVGTAKGGKFISTFTGAINNQKHEASQAEQGEEMKVMVPLDVELRQIKAKRGQFQNQTLSSRLAQDESQDLQEKIAEHLRTFEQRANLLLRKQSKSPEGHTHDIFRVNAVEITNIDGIENYRTCFQTSEVSKNHKKHVGISLIKSLKKDYGFLPNYNSPNNQQRKRQSSSLKNELQDKLKQKRRPKQLSQGIQIKTIQPIAPIRPKKVEIDYEQTFIFKVDTGILIEEKKSKKIIVDEVAKDEQINVKVSSSPSKNTKQGQLLNTEEATTPQKMLTSRPQLGIDQNKSSPNVILSKIQNQVESPKSMRKSPIRSFKQHPEKIILSQLITDKNTLLDKHIQIVQQNNSLQYLNESQNLPDLLSQTKDSMATISVGRKTPFIKSQVINNMQARVNRRPKLYSAGQSHQTNNFKRLKSAKVGVRKLNCRGVPPEAPREERRLMTLRTVSFGNNGEIQLGLPKALQLGDGLDMAGIHFDKHLRTAFMQMAQKNQGKSKSSAGRASPNIFQIGEIQGIELLHERKMSQTHDSAGTELINKSDLHKHSNFNSHFLNISRNNRLSKILSVERSRSNQTKVNLTRQDEIRKEFLHKKSQESIEVKDQLRSKATEQTNYLSDSENHHAILVFQKKGNHYFQRVFDQELMMITGKKIDSTLERPQESPMQGRTSDIKHEQALDQSKNKSGRQSKQSLTEVVTAMRSSDSEKILVASNKSLIKNINQDNQKLSIRKVSAHIKVEKGIRNISIEELDQQKTHRDSQNDPLFYQPPERIKIIEEEKQEKFITKQRRQLTFGGKNLIIDAKSSEKIYFYEPPNLMILKTDSDRYSTITPYLKTNLTIKSKHLTNKTNSISDTTEPIETDSSLKKTEEEEKPKRAEHIYAINSNLDTVVEALSPEKSRNISASNSEKEPKLRQTETMYVQTDFKDDIDISTHDLGDGQNGFDLEATKNWLLKKYQEPYLTQQSFISPNQQSNLVYLSNTNTGFINRVPIPQDLIVLKQNLNSNGTLQSMNSTSLQLSPNSIATQPPYNAPVYATKYEQVTRTSEEHNRNEKRDLVLQRKKAMIVQRNHEPEFMNSKMIKLDQDNLQIRQLVESYLQEQQKQISTLSQEANRKQGQRIIFKSCDGSNTVINPSIQEVLSGPVMQDALKLIGRHIDEQGIQKRQEIKKQIYEKRKNLLQYKRRRCNSPESNSTGAEKTNLIEVQQKPMRIGSTLKKEYILNVDNSDAFNSIQSLEESYKGQINVIQKKVKQNKSNMEKDGMMFQPGQNIVSIDKGQVVQNRFMYTERPLNHGWDGIKEVTDISKDHDHDRGDDIDTIYMQSMIQIQNDTQMKPNSKTKLPFRQNHNQEINSLKSPRPMTLGIKNRDINILEFGQKKASQPQKETNTFLFTNSLKRNNESSFQCDRANDGKQFFEPEPISLKIESEKSNLPTESTQQPLENIFQSNQKRVSSNTSNLLEPIKSDQSKVQTQVQTRPMTSNVLPTFRNPIEDPTNHEDSLKKLQQVANIRINRSRKKTNVNVETSDEEVTESTQLKKFTTTHYDFRGSQLFSNTHAQWLGRQQNMVKMANRPQTTKASKQSHHDRKMQYLMFKRGEQSKHQNQTENEFQSFGRNHFLSGSMLQQKNKVDKTEISSQNAAPFFKLASNAISSAFSCDKTSNNIVKSMNRHKNDLSPQSYKQTKIAIKVDRPIVRKIFKQN